MSTSKPSVTNEPEARVMVDVAAVNVRETPEVAAVMAKWCLKSEYVAKTM